VSPRLANYARFGQRIVTIVRRIILKISGNEIEIPAATK